MLCATWTICWTQSCPPTQTIIEGRIFLCLIKVSIYALMCYVTCACFYHLIASYHCYVGWWDGIWCRLTTASFTVLRMREGGRRSFLSLICSSWWTHGRQSGNGLACVGRKERERVCVCEWVCVCVREGGRWCARSATSFIRISICLTLLLVKRCKQVSITTQRQGDRVANTQLLWAVSSCPEQPCMGRPRLNCTCVCVTLGPRDTRKARGVVVRLPIPLYIHTYNTSEWSEMTSHICDTCLHRIFTMTKGLLVFISCLLLFLPSQVACDTRFGVANCQYVFCLFDRKRESS